MTTGAQTGQPMAAVTDRDLFGAGGRLFVPSVVAPAVVPAIGENNDGLIGAVLGAAGEAPYVRVRTIEDRKLGPERTLSRPELGPVDPALGFDVAADRASGAVVAWVQGGAEDRKLVAGYLDRPPGFFAGYTSQRCCQGPLPRLSWQPSLNIWGPVRYVVSVDGKPVGETADTRCSSPSPLAPGTHRWQVRRVRRARAEQAPPAPAALRIDARAPSLAVRYKRKQARRARCRCARATPACAGARRPACARSSCRGATGTKGAGGTASVRASHRYRAPRQLPAADHRDRPRGQRAHVAAHRAHPASGRRRCPLPVRSHDVAAAGRTLALGGRPWLMGIVNASPDSFSDAGAYPDLDARVALARELLAAGADILDVGGESGITLRPAVAVDEEIARVVPLIERLAGELGAVVSVDTYKPAVAEAAIAAGAVIVNDVSGLRDPALADVCARDRRGARAHAHARGAQAAPAGSGAATTT